MKNISVVGGNIVNCEKSSIINKISLLLKDYSKDATVSTYNGSLPSSLTGQDLVLWMPDIDNTITKKYLSKDKGSVLVCSKVMRDGYTHIDSVSRIFKMHGNAVIEIYKQGNCLFEFMLVDALNNVWCDRTTDIREVVKAIIKIYDWTKGSKRKSLVKKNRLSQFDNICLEEYYKFITLNMDCANKVAIGCGNRFFGNYSTRCTKLFPSYKTANELFLFSPRNTDKRHLTVLDKVICDYDSYYGDTKPSVDTPAQLEVYKNCDGINYMIHGHAYIKGVVSTKDYFPCGDLREVDGILSVMAGNCNAINLKNHGFLLTGGTLNEITVLVDDCLFYSL